VNGSSCWSISSDNSQHRLFKTTIPQCLMPKKISTDRIKLKRLMCVCVCGVCCVCEVKSEKQEAKKIDFFFLPLVCVFFSAVVT
jgi:hypothetical protein